jgi:nucleotide-binding universal stress UspA family protein
MALRKAVDIATLFKAKIYLLHVIDDHLFEYGSDVGMGIVIDIKTGNSAEAVPTGENEKGIDLIAIGAQERTGMLHQLIGSVAGKLARRATCPFFIVK